MSPQAWMILLFAVMWTGIGAGVWGLYRFLREHERAKAAGEDTFDHGL
jgi:hypothetical protein